MDEHVMFSLLVDLHRDGPRQGPGSDAETLRALELTRLDRAAGPHAAEADEIAAGERREADLYRRYRACFSYGFSIVRRR
jgi:hypothetical protein